jgi:hypothetical protein
VEKQPARRASTEISSSLDQVKPLHLAPEPASINHEGKRDDEGTDGTGHVRSRWSQTVDPETPNPDAKRKQGGKDNEDDVKAFE